jgi:hypothetical protein
MSKGASDKEGNIIYPFQFNGGVNALHHPTAIRDNQMTRCANMFPDESGILMKRAGVSNIELIDLEIAGGAYEVVYFPLNIFLPDAALGYKYLKHYFLMGEGLGDDLDERVTLFNADTAHYDTRPTITVGVGGQSTDPLSFVNYANKTLIVGARNLDEGFYYWRKADGDGNGVSAFHATFVHTVGTGVPNAQTQSIPVKPRVSCTYQGRVWYFNFGIGMGHWAVAADATTPNHTNNDTMPVFTVVGNDVLAFNGRHIELDASGENIVLAREIMLMSTGSPTQSSLLVVTDKGSCFLGTGVLPETFEDPTANPTTLTFQKINYKVGCCAFNTMVHTPYGYIWADANDVWVLSGNVPLKIGTLIGPELAKYPEDARKWWSAAYVDYKYILQCVSYRGSDDKYLSREQWWLDLTNGLPAHSLMAKWFGPMKIVRDIGDEGNGGSFGDGPYLSGILTDYDGSRVIGLSTDGSYTLNGGAHGLSLIDYTFGNGGPDVPFKTVTGAPEWTPTTSYIVGDVVRASFYMNTGTLLVCSTAGTSGNLDPAIFATPGNGAVIDGGTGLDGTAAWTEITASNYRFLTTNYTTQLLSNSMDIRTKEFVLGRPEADKVLRNVDLLAYSPFEQFISARIIPNQGAISDKLNLYIFALFGQDIGAFKSGVSVLDSSALAHGQLEGKSLRPIEGKLNRFKSLQLNFFDGTPFVFHDIRFNGPYVIDSTNNSLVFGFYNSIDSEIQLFQATLTLQSSGAKVYSNIEDLYTDIVLAMNTVIGAGGSFPSGPDPSVTVGTAPFTYVPPNSVNNTYFNQIKCLSSAKGAHTGWALFYGHTDATVVSDRVGHTGTFDLLKSKKLMAMIGMDTQESNQASTNLDGIVLPVGVWFSPINVAADNFVAGSLKIWAKQIMPYNLSGDIHLTEGVIHARTTTTDPLSFSNR